MRAVKNNLPTPSGKVGSQKALAGATGTSWRASGWVGEKRRAQWKTNQPPSLKRKRESLERVSLATRYGLACGMARLSAPGLGG